MIFPIFSSIIIKIKIVLILGLAIGIYSKGAAEDIPDSLKTLHKFSYIGSMTGSFKYSNETKKVLLTINDKLDLDYKIKNYKNYSIQAKWKQELAYCYFWDSLKKKDLDKMLLVLDISKMNSRKSFKMTFEGPIFNSYKYKFNSKTKELEKSIAGYTLSPSLLNIGFGYSIGFFKNSSFSFNYINLVARIEPYFDNIIPENKQWYLYKTNKTVCNVDYGYSLVLDIKEKLDKKTEVSFLLTSCGSGLSRYKVFFDASSSIRYYITKNIMATLSCRLMYNPMLTLEAKILSEFSLGYYIKSK